MGHHLVASWVISYFRLHQAPMGPRYAVGEDGCLRVQPLPTADGIAGGGTAELSDLAHAAVGLGGILLEMGAGELILAKMGRIKLTIQ